jgi:hypothetical protein
MTTKITTLWCVMVYSLVDRYVCCGGTCYLYFRVYFLQHTFPPSRCALVHECVAQYGCHDVAKNIVVYKILQHTRT